MDKKDRKEAPKLGASKKKASKAGEPAKKVRKKTSKVNKKSSRRKLDLKLDMSKESSPMMKLNATLAMLILIVGIYLAFTGQLDQVLAPILP